MLGDHSCGLEVGLSELWEETCKKQLVSEFPIRVVHLWGHFFKLQLFLEQRCGSVATQSEGSEFSPLLASLFLPLGADGDQREFDLETRVTTNGNLLIPEMFHSCTLNK